ncbi:ABC transporter ATP-binding protein [Paenibacillus sp. Soil766]|uniref:ABC transporter ATP-binding protein n=1 Tax=Paenibacillus sp. Soil766 TaxID=1736404 RepID=UPI0007C716DC|nr:ABC transporter ATP-binding protein [Paenibacillus sp. Soil766]
MNGLLKMKEARRTYKVLKPYIRQHRKPYIGLFLLLFIEIMLTIGFSWFFGTITDAAIHSDITRMKWLVPLGITLVLISITSTYLFTLWETIATNAVKRDFSEQLFKHILQLPGKQVERIHSGDLLAHFTNDIHNLDGIIGSSLINLIKLPFIYGAVLIYLLQIHWKLALLCTFVAPVAMVSGVIFGILLRNNNRRIQNLVVQFNVLLNETFQGFFVIRSFLMEKAVFTKYAIKNKKLYALELNNARLRGWFYVGSQAAASITFLVSLCLGSYYISIGLLSVGALLTFINLVNHLVYPLTEFAGQWAGIQKSMSAMERIFRVLEIEVESDDFPAAMRVEPLVSSITFNDITFHYEGQANLFEHLNVHIPAGKIVAIVGLSGAGKTTLFNLLQGFYKPQTGEIAINGRQISNLSVSERRSLFAHVSQETMLFSGTIRDNLLVARLDITDRQMVEATKMAGIHTYISTLPQGYDTEIGENGLKLSGGQRQRLAIARAILKEAPILLLDEGTSALDSETEYHVKAALDRLMHNRTTLIITHRLASIHKADYIIVMEQGEIVQMGRHEDMMQKEGVYRRLQGMESKRGEWGYADAFDQSVV